MTSNQELNKFPFSSISCRTNVLIFALSRHNPNTILAADIEEASALIALEAANLLAGITDEQFRLNVRHRIAERLVQTPTISAD
ncbi:TPA: hypothetical protein ACKR1V_002237 [Pseudomonas aeruginosa]|uniref:hypothetical protein n=1 Tax=Pseudomonas aeruginosa TaxID=287 RepID=UPI000AEA5557|nr:hypothetical protein [Pseudomonas aeruginosa]